MFMAGNYHIIHSSECQMANNEKKVAAANGTSACNVNLLFRMWTRIAPAKSIEMLIVLLLSDHHNSAS